MRATRARPAGLAACLAKAIEQVRSLHATT